LAHIKEALAFVKKVLGKGRFELFRDGKIGLNRMVSKDRIKRLGDV